MNNVRDQQIQKRALRRHHLKRMKKKAEYISKSVWGLDGNVLNKSYNHLKTCSCLMCGNPRKYFGEKTLQERKFCDQSYYG